MISQFEYAKKYLSVDFELGELAGIGICVIDNTSKSWRPNSNPLYLFFLFIVL